MKHVAHGMSMTGWMLEFETDENHKTKVWNEAAARLDDKETETRVVEQTNRMLSVHPAEERCGMCPVPSTPPQDPAGPNVDGVPGEPLPGDDGEDEPEDKGPTFADGIPDVPPPKP